MLLTHPSGPLRLVSRLPLLSSLITAPTHHAVVTASNNDDTLAAYLIAAMTATGLLNWLWVGPQTTEIMRLRKHQETRDGKKSYEPGPHSVDMQRLNKRFGVLHGVSSLVNLVGLAAMVWYAGVLAEGLRL